MTTDAAVSHRTGRYGFSDASPNSEAGNIVDALWEALQANGEKGPYVLIGEGYGG